MKSVFALLTLVMLVSGCNQAEISHKTCEKGEMKACERSCQEFSHIEDCEKLPEYYKSQKDLKGMLSVLGKLCDAGRAEACGERGFLHNGPESAAPDDAEAKAYFEKGCEGGHATSCVDLAYHNLGKDEAKASELFGKGCDLKVGHGCWMLTRRLRKEGSDASARQARSRAQMGCDLKHPESCNLLAIMLFHGEGGDADTPQAARLYEKACLAESWAACYNLASLRDDGGDLEKAMELMTRACEGEIWAACNDRGVMVFDRATSDEQKAAAAKDFQKACENGNGPGCGNLARRKEAEQDFEQARKLYVQACKAEVPWACHFYALMVLDGRGGSADVVRASVEFEKSCKADFAPACMSLGQLRAVGRGVSKDAAQAAELYEKACTLSPVDCGEVANAYADGVGVVADPKKAEAYFRKACEAGRAEACRELGERLLNGDGLPQDSKAGQTWLREACQQKELEACSVLGVALIGGETSLRDLAEGERLLTASCNEGVALSCEFLGGFYEMGSLGAEDLSKALDWYRKGCELAPVACTPLARCHALGIGTPQNLEEAARLREHACSDQPPGECQRFDFVLEIRKNSSINQQLAPSLRAFALGQSGTGRADLSAVIPWMAGANTASEEGVVEPPPAADGEGEGSDEPSAETPAEEESSAETPTREGERPDEGKQSEAGQALGEPLSKDEIALVLRGTFLLVRSCTRAAEPSDPKGSLVVSFTIGPDGKVLESAIDSEAFVGTKVGQCVLGVVDDLEFRASGASTPVSYPFPIK